MDEGAMWTRVYFIPTLLRRSYKEIGIIVVGIKKGEVRMNEK